MASIIVGDLEVQVTIPGSAPGVFCHTVSLGIGTEGSSATLFAAGREWDVGSWRGRPVKVEARYSGAWQTVFLGLIDGEAARTDGSGVDLTARSLITYADSVFIGQHWSPGGGLVANYPVYAQFPGNKRWYITSWNPASIIGNWFAEEPVPTSWWGGGGSLPAAWRGVLKLGEVDALVAAGTARPPAPNGLQWRVVSLLEGFDAMLGMSPNLSFRERFDGDVTYLDFFKMADETASSTTLKVAVAGQSIVDAEANVLAIDREESITTSKNRVIAIGDRSKFIISLTTNLNVPVEEPDPPPDPPPAPSNYLERLWLDEWAAKIIRSPEGYQPNCSRNMEPWPAPTNYAFRRYRLPECLRPPYAFPQESIPLRIGEDAQVRMQVWRRGVDYEWDVEGMRMVAVPRPEPELVEGWDFDPATGTLWLKEPNIYVSEIRYRMRPKATAAPVEWINGVPIRGEDPADPEDPDPDPVPAGHWVGVPVRDCLDCTWVWAPPEADPFPETAGDGFPEDNGDSGGAPGAGEDWPNIGLPCLDITEGMLFGGAGNGMPFGFDPSALSDVPGYRPFEPCIPTLPWEDPPVDPWVEQPGAELEAYTEQFYCESPLGITLCVAGSHIAHDSGPATGLGIDPIAADGLTEAFDAPGFGFIQVTNVDFPAHDSAGGSYVFPVTRLNIDGTWVVWETATVYQDDRSALAAYATAAQAEASQIRKAYEIETPYFNGDLKIGDRISLVGQSGFDGGTHQIRQVHHDLTADHRTRISTDNQKALPASTVLSNSESFA